jgi:hypothetical protein
MSIYYLTAFSVATLLLLPLLKPKVLNNAFYLVNIPFLLTVGLGSVFSGPNSFVYSESSESSARQGLIIYLVLVFICSCVRQFSLYSLGIVFDGASSSINGKLINRICPHMLFLFLMSCLPYWFTIDIKSSGIYSLFFDPLSHILAREETIKLAEQTFALKLYIYGNFLAPLLVLMVLTTNFPKILFIKINWLAKVAIILIITFLANINGSRSGFIMPLLTALYSLFILDFQLSRSLLIQKLFSINRLLLRKSFILSLLVAVVLSIGLFSVILYVSFLRIAREFSFDFASNLLISVTSRAFVVPFSTGVSNIWAINDMNLPFSYYFGGFPGFTYLFGAREPLFMVTGSHYLSMSRGLAETTMNMNTSGLFINIAFWGLLGPFLTVTFLGFNIFYFPRLLRAFSSASSAYCFVPIFSALMIAEISLNITSSIISFFPMQWILFTFLLVLTNNMSRLRLGLKG